MPRVGSSAVAAKMNVTTAKMIGNRAMSTKMPTTIRMIFRVLLFFFGSSAGVAAGAGAEEITGAGAGSVSGASVEAGSAIGAGSVTGSATGAGSVIDVGSAIGVGSGAGAGVGSVESSGVGFIGVSFILIS